MQKVMDLCWIPVTLCLLYAESIGRRTIGIYILALTMG